MRTVLPALACLTACTPRAVTPPARTFAMDSPTVPAIGHGDAQLDLAGVSSALGPSLASGGGHVRRSVAPGVTLEGDAGLLRVTNDGSGPGRDAYTGRLGVLWKRDPDARSAV